MCLTILATPVLNLTDSTDSLCADSVSLLFINAKYFPTGAFSFMEETYRE